MSVWGKLEKRIRKLVKKKKDDEKRGSGGSGKPAAKATPPAAKVKVETKVSAPTREDYTPRGTGSNVIDAVGRKIYSPTLRGTGFSTTTPSSRLKTVDTKLMDMASSRKADTAVKKADIELKSMTNTLKKRSDNALKDPKEARRLSQDRDASTLTAGTAKGKNLTDSVNAAGKLKNADAIKAELKQKSKATERREWHEATGHRYDVDEKGISDAEKQKRRQNVKMRPHSADTAVAEAEHAMKYNREGESFARGALSGATFGASDLIAKKGTKGEARKAEDVYQEKKSKGAEIAGEVVGSLASFGTTAAATDKVAAKVGGKAMERAAEKLAGRKVIQKSATKAAEKLVAKGGAKEVTAELIKEIGQDKAKRVVTALGNDIVQNLTTGALMDINRASTQHEVGSKEWWGEIGRSAAFNAAITTGIGGVALATGSRRVAKAAANRLSAKGEMAENIAKRAGDNSRNRIGRYGQTIDEAIDARTPKRVPNATAEDIAGTVKQNTEEAAETTVKKAPPRKPTKAEARRAALQEERRALEEELRAAREAGEDTSAILDDMQLNDMEMREVDAKIERAGKARATKAANKEAAEAAEAAAERGTTVETEKRVRALREEMTQAANDARDTRLSASQRRAASDRMAEIAEELRSIREPAAEATETAARNADEAAETAAETTAESTARNAEPATEAEKPKAVKGKQQIQDENLRADKQAKLEAARAERARLAAAGEDTSKIDKRIRKLETQIDDLDDRIARAEKDRETRYENMRVVDSPEEMMAGEKQPLTRREKAKARKEKLEMELFDSLAPFEKLARAKRKTDKAGMRKDFGVINALRLFRAKADQSITKGQLNYMEKNVGKSLNEIWSNIPEEARKDFDLYLYLKHAPARAKEGTPIFDSALKSGELLDDPIIAAREAERLKNKHPEIDFEAKADEVYAYVRQELQNRVDAGLISKETADDWIARHPFYVPTHRDGFNEVSGMKGRTVGAEGEKAAKGSNYNLRSIREQLEEATVRNWRDITTNNLFRRMFGEDVAADLAKDADGGVERVLENSVSVYRHNNKYYARVWNNGEAKEVEIDKIFHDALEDLNKNGRTGVAWLDAGSDLTAGLSDFWKKLVTEWSPFFLVKNFAKDTPEAIINSRNRVAFLENYVPAILDIARGGEYSKALQRSGVSQSTFVGYGKSAGEMEKLSGIGKFNQAVEMWPRLAEYMGTIKSAGYTVETAPKELLDEAAANAADVTVNFQRGGSLGKALNRGLVPFFNPSIQGMSKFARNFLEADSVKTMVGTAVLATAMGVAPDLINEAMIGDDPNYAKISDRDKANNYIFPINKEEGIYARIPKARFVVPFDLAFDTLTGRSDMDFAQIIKVGTDAVGPVDITTSFFGAPLANAAANRTWFDTPIVSEALQGLDPWEQVDSNTSWLGKKAGEMTQKLPTSVQISPKKFDYVADQLGGVAADLVLPALTPSRQGGGDNALEKGGYAVKNSLSRPFTIDSVTQNELSTKFYDQMESAEHKKNSSKATEADADEYKRMNAYSSEISGINQAIRTLQGSTKKTKQLDIRELQKVRNQLMQDGLDGKDAPSKQKTMDAVQRSVGTTYAVNNLGKSADQEAMRWYGLKKYGDLSDEEMQKKIDADKGFYKGVKSIGNLDSKVKKATGKSGTTTLGKAVALVDAGADDDLLGAYGCTKQGRNETASKADRAKSYLSNGGSVNEYVKLENARKNLGKLKSYDQSKETAALEKQIANGEISLADARKKQDEIEYNANISYVGLATSLASANSPGRGYELYDIKAKNVQKGINLAAMGFTARDYRKMVKELDADGNGYAKASEIRDYVAKSDFEDKATLYDALYSYKGKYNPFGTPTNYTRAQAANAGKAKGVKWIVNDMDEINVKDSDSSSGGSGYYRRGYYRRGYRRWGSGGSGGSGSGKVSMAKTKVPAIKTNISGGSVNHSNVNVNATIKAKSMASKNNSGGSRVAVKLEPPMLKVEKAKLKKYEV